MINHREKKNSVVQQTFKTAFFSFPIIFRCFDSFEIIDEQKFTTNERTPVIKFPSLIEERLRRFSKTPLELIPNHRETKLPLIGTSSSFSQGKSN